MVPSIPRRTGWSVGPWRGLEASSSSSFPSGPGECPATAASAQASSARVLLLPGPPQPPPSPSGLGAAASGELERAAAEDSLSDELGVVWKWCLAGLLRRGRRSARGLTRTRRRRHALSSGSCLLRWPPSLRT